MRQLLSNLQAGLSSLPSSSIASSSASLPPPLSSNSVENLGHSLLQLQSSLEQLQQPLSSLATLLTRESTLTSSRANTRNSANSNTNQRNEAQQLATQISPLLEQVGVLCLLLSSSLSSVRMGDAPGKATAIPPPSQNLPALPRVGQPNNNNNPNTTASTAPLNATNLPQAIQVSMPLFTVAPRNASGASAPPPNTSSQVNTPPNNILATVCIDRALPYLPPFI